MNTARQLKTNCDRIHFNRIQREGRKKHLLGSPAPSVPASYLASEAQVSHTQNGIIKPTLQGCYNDYR